MTTARATGAAGATSAARLEDIARRLSSLPHDKQEAFTGWLAERGISVLSLPIVPQLRPDALPLSFAQRRLWLLDRLHPGSAQYNIPRIYALAGALDRDALARALGDLVERHEALRTTFGELDGAPVQRIAAAPPLDLVIEHAGDLIAARAIADDEAARPFDLTRGVFRARVLRIAGDVHWLVVTSHHIAMDEWSDAIVARELAELYDAHHRRRAHRLAALPIQYADFALWQRRWLTDDMLASQLAHWRAELGTGDHEPTLAVEAGTGDHARADALRFRLEPALDARLRAFAARARTTLFTTLLAVFQIALHRLGGSRDLRIGSPIANRNRREIEGVIGCFANTQVLRAQLAPGMTFAHHLEAVKRTVAAAQSHQDLPFERLVEALAPERALGETPLFQVMFSWHRGAAELHTAAGGLTITQEPAIDRVAKFDLVLHMTDDEAQIEGELLYRTARLSRDVIAALADGIQRIAAAVLDTPDRPIAVLPVIADAARERITRVWNATGATATGIAAMPGNAAFDGLHARIAAWARVTPDAPALQCEGERLDYRALDDGAARIAGALAARGVRPEDRVALCLPRSIDLVVGMVGIMSCGAAYVPLDPRTPPERLRELLGDAGIAHAIARGDAADLLRALGVDVLDDADPSALPLRAHVSPDTAAYVIYTSGSTGRPKGVVVHHGAITSYACGVRERLALPAGAAMALVSTPTADLGHTVLFGALVGGGLLHVVAEDRCFDADRMAAYLRANPIDVLKITPSHLGGLLQAASPADVLPRHALILGGEAAPAELLARIRGLAPCRIINHYGPTETTVGVLTYEARDGEDRLPLGTPLPGRRAYVLDAALAPQPPGVYGELYIGGDGVACGYLGRPGTTADRFVPDPFRPDGGRLYRTGDRARYRADGAIEFAGRTDDQIKLRGHRIEPGEVRAALLRAPGVADAHVALHDTGTGPRLIGYVVAGGGRADEAAVLAAVAAWLPEHMVPAELVWLERFPVTANGKIDRKALPAPGRPVVAASRAPSNELERQIAAVWCDVLQRDSVGIDDRFFTIGGDSLLAFQVVARLREAGMSLTIPELFANQTIAALARVVRSGGGDAATALAVPVEGDVALTPIQHWFFDHALERPHHYNQSVLLALRAPIAPETLADALARLVAHHDGLRLRFTRDTGGWRQAYVDAAAAPAALDVVSVGDAPAAIARAQRSIDLANGPVLRAVLYDRRLLLIAHHLVVDGMSWRILVDDLARMLAGGAPLPAPASYQAWAAALTGHARGAALAEAAHWRAIAAADTALPADGDERGNTVGSARIASAALDADATRALLTRTPAAYRTRVDDVLLTALALALCEWSGRPGAVIRLEHHGRAPLFDGIDVSRTIGWFTSAYPVELTPAGGLAASLKQIKEQLRAVRHHGVGHGALRYLARDPALATADPRLTFNYLGQLDSVLDESGALAAAPAHEPTGDDRDPAAPRDRWFDVIAMVEGGRLHIEWHYSPALHAPATVERLAARMLEHLAGLIAHCSDPAQRGATPSDFPLAGLEQTELDRVLARAPLEEVEDILPLTPVQDGILFHCLAAPEDGLYITQRTIDLDHAIGGTLDLSALCTAWQEVAAAHDALRTGFVTDGVRRPIQIVWRTAAVAIERAIGELDDVLRADRARGFDLARPPLMRVTLREVAPGHSQLIWTVHHLLLDGWSAWRVLAEVLARYQAIAGGAPLPIERSAPIRDHLAWLAGLDHARADAYWRDQLASVVSPTLLAPRLAPAGGAGRAPADGAHREELALSEAATARLRGFAERHALTTNTLVQGALAIVIGAYTSSDDVVFGATVSGRGGDLPGGAERIGLFINTLPLRVRLPAAARVVDWLAALQTANAAMREYEHTPLVRAQRQSAARGALFDTLLVFENYPIARGLGPAAERLGVGATGAHERTSYPLTLEVAPGERLRLQLDVHGIAAGAARSVLLRIAAALDQLTTADRLADVWPVFADERARLVQWNATAVAPPTTTVTHALFEACADRTPSAIAVIDRDRRLCYGELDARADQLAWRLIDAGVGPESIVAIGAPRSLELVIGLLAIWKAGAGYLPIDPDYPAARIAHMIDDARPAVVLAGGAFVWPGAWRLDEPARGADRGRPSARTQRDQLAYCIYTSGSTGMPKGVAVSHASLLNFLAAMQRQLGFDAGDAFLGLTSLSFDIAALELWLPLTRGARLVLAEPEEAASADRLIDRLARGEVTAVQATPTTWRTLSATGPALPATSRLLCGGEPMPPDLAARLVARAPRVLNVYGPTETTVWSTLYALDPAHPEPSIGRPIDNTEIHILDGALRPVPPGATGELTIAGLGLARGYLRRPALTAERFIPDPFGAPGARMYRAGDLARHRADGTLVCLGRSDDQIKLRGHRIELGEIETCLRAQPGVGHAAVAARGPGEPRLVAYVVGDPTLEPTLRAALAAALPAIMRPAHYAFLAELPRTANGKLDRKALPDPDRAARPLRVAPRTATERTLAELWSRILPRGEIGVDDDFFALGGDSLTALQLVIAARGAGLALSPRDPFEHPTIAALAAHLAASVGASADSQPEDERSRFAHSGLDAGELSDLLEDLA